MKIAESEKIIYIFQKSTKFIQNTVKKLKSLHIIFLKMITSTDNSNQP